ncbi:PREDICTED: zinc finger protein 511-like [Priapulus caudatus]|uniref:Zinc finger protein 511-like n=1 Tax=Priapulus caudatus TaxID=37621 RepID=A0ABM1DZK1_PRICU|nr:PREDICTED: zinc finger protein 511-like [Priapulus caudatus]
MEVEESVSESSVSETKSMVYSPIFLHPSEFDNLVQVVDAHNDLPEKQVVTMVMDSSSNGLNSDSQAGFFCYLPACGREFSSMSVSESHYNLCHRHVCEHCKRVFPTSQLLEIHVLEWHDVLFNVLTMKQDMFQCIVEGCSIVFKDSEQRWSHVTAYHIYPTDFRFFRSSSAKTQKPQVGKKQQGVAMECDTKNERMKEGDATFVDNRALQRFPKKISFGHGIGRGFQHTNMQKKKKKGKQWHAAAKDESMDSTVNLENIKLTDLASALDDK